MEELKGNQNSSKYEFIENLGQGAFGTAMKVFNKDDNKIYVIKKIFLKEADKKELNHIQNEANILSSIDNEHIVKYYDSFYDKDSFNIVMEYCKGLDLRKFINEHKAKNKFIEKNIIYHIISNIAIGLKEIHSKNLIHRDLKPDNLFVSGCLSIKIGDFGIAKQLKSVNDFASTQAGTMIYMAPEIANGKSYNNKVDIWSLGCIIHELCTLQYCFEPKSLNELVTNIMNVTHGKINTKIYGDDLQHLIDWLLNKDYTKRPSAEEIFLYISKYLLSSIFKDIERLFKEDEVYENYLIEKNIEDSLDQVSITILERENKYSRMKYNLGYYFIGFLACFLTCGSSFLLQAGLCWGSQLIFTLFSEKVIGKNFKENFINDNQIIIQAIQKKMIKIINDKLDGGLIKTQKIIVYSQEKFEEKIKKIKDKLISSKYIKKLKSIITKNFNILLVGCTNAGKSTLINEFLKLESEQKAKESTGGPTDTIDFTPYKGKNNNKQYTLFDTNGITNTGVDSSENKIKNTLKQIEKRIESKDPNKLIHCIWYCFQGSNVQPSDGEFIKKLLQIYTSYSIPIIIVHTQTYSLEQSKICKNGIKKYLKEIYGSDEEKIKEQLKNYINVLARGTNPGEKKDEDEDDNDDEIIIQKPIQAFGLDKLESVSKKQIEVKGFKSAYYEFIKKDIIPILINGVFNLIFTENNINKMIESAKKDLDKYLETILIILGDDKLGLNDNIKNQNKKSLEKVYDSFKNARNNLKNELFFILNINQLKNDNKDLIKEVYDSKSETYKKNMNYNTFTKNVENLIYDNMANNSDSIINNILNTGFNCYIIELIKEGIRKQFEEKEEKVLSEIYTEIFKENK